jgi:hypothetical protein
MNFVEQLTAMALLVDFFLGVTVGIVGSAVRGSLLEDRHRTLLRRAPDLLSEGAREMLALRRRDDGYLASLLAGGGQVPETRDGRRGGDSGAQGTEPKR